MDFLKTGLGIFGVSLAISIILGPIMIRMLNRLKAGQSIREDGPESHHKKSGTPTIGGLIFIFATVLAVAVAGIIKGSAIPLLAMLGFGLVGFVDDFIKVVLKRNLGLTAKQKIAGQVLVSVLIAILVYYQIGSEITIPFLKREIDLGIAIIPFLIIVMVATPNSANLTDGLDGLATSVTAIILFAFAYIAKQMGVEDIFLFAMALAGACIGFLKVNFNPAKVFMGDTGSMALGGAVVGIAMVLKLTLLIPIIALIYFVEALSVIIQVAYYKRTQKRIFLMSPLHHHYEKKGFSEKQIVFAFSLVTLLLSIVGILSVK